MVYNIGDNIKIIDHISGIEEEGCVCYVEPDEFIPNYYWYYVVSYDKKNNTISDPKFNFLYWKIIESVSTYIVG